MTSTARKRTDSTVQRRFHVTLAALWNAALQAAPTLPGDHPLVRRVRSAGEDPAYVSSWIRWLFRTEKLTALIAAVDEHLRFGLPPAPGPYRSDRRYLADYCETKPQRCLQAAANEALRRGLKCFVHDGEVFAVDESEDHRKPLIVETGLPAVFLAGFEAIRPVCTH